MNNGTFVISLDFELMWGVRDSKTIEQYGKNILGVHDVIPKLLTVFERHKISATFSTVGFLFFESKTELLENIPSIVPGYDMSEYSPYVGYLDTIGENYKKDLYHFAPQLINKIKEHPDQEIGSHTFSHYYCLEKGQTIEEFRADMMMSIEVARKKGVVLTSLVFPRNQFNNEYLEVCRELGIVCYRGNENSWLYKAKNRDKESGLRRALRLIDAYINISGHNCYSYDRLLKSGQPMDVPSSRFLRPYIKKLKALDRLKLRRIKSGMTYAAKKNLLYHLWWHPHNFGVNQTENFAFLEQILFHYDYLNNKYNFQSVTMSRLASELKNEK